MQFRPLTNAAGDFGEVHVIRPARAAMARENKLLARVSKTKFAVVGKRTAKFWQSRFFVMRFDRDYLVIACSLAVIGAAFILFLAM